MFNYSNFKLLGGLVMAIPENISRHHVIEAFNIIDKGEIPPRRTLWQYAVLSETGKQYPPKYVIEQANKIANNPELTSNEFNTTQAQKYLARLGFEIIEISEDGIEEIDMNFNWIPFYEELAEKILEYKDKRKELMEIMQQLYKEESLLSYLNFEREDWWGPANYEIDPFSVFGSFNRGITDKNRSGFAQRFAEIFDIKADIPQQFSGIPVLNNMQAFYNNSKGVLWELFIEAMSLAKSENNQEEFSLAFDNALLAKGNGLSKITMGLYWIRPKYYLSLDSRNQQYLWNNFNIDLRRNKLDGKLYLDFQNKIKEEIKPLSIPDISLNAWNETLVSNYSPDLSSDQWLALLKEPTIFNQQGLEIMKRLMDYGGSASCTQLANKYGETKNFYNRGSSALGERIYKKTQCNLYIEYGKNRWWRILYTGTIAQKEDEGSFIWTLRPELKEALDQMDLSHISLYANQSEYINGGVDVNQSWWINARSKFWSFSEINVGETIEYTSYTENNRKRRVYQNFLDAKLGDKVLCYETNPVKQIVALGEISKEHDGQTIEIRKLENLENPIDYLTLRESEELTSLEFFVNPNGTLFKVTPQEYDFILDTIREENPKAEKALTYEKYDKSDFLKDVFLSEKTYDTLKDLLAHKKNIILQGAPGVGKTYAAKRLAWSILGQKDEDRVLSIQFHQNYSYEDFVMGYKPKGDSFELQDGIFIKFCRTAANNPDNNYFLIIDEINRGNMSKIFGELLMLIEKDYRGHKIKLAYSGQSFSVPANLYIIGMMNTADRSLAMIDYALRRRFSFFEMEAGFESEGFKDYQTKLNDESFSRLISKIQNLNAQIESDPSLGKGFCIGHSYFANQEIFTDVWMKQVIQYDILPLLKEYWFDENDKVRYWEEQLRGVFND